MSGEDNSRWSGTRARPWPKMRRSTDWVRSPELEDIFGKGLYQCEKKPFSHVAEGGCEIRFCCQDSRHGVYLVELIRAGAKTIQHTVSVGDKGKNWNRALREFREFLQKALG